VHNKNNWHSLTKSIFELLNNFMHIFMKNLEKFNEFDSVMSEFYVSTLYSAKAIIVQHRILWTKYIGRWLLGSYILYIWCVCVCVCVWRENWAGPQPTQARSCCTKCNIHQQPVYQSSYCCIIVHCSAVLMYPLKG